jgi:hypothetical protein
MLYEQLTAALGYTDSPLFLGEKDDGNGLIALSDQHWLRSARKAGVKGSYFFKTSPEPKAVRPAVHVAKASTVDEARAIHRKLWNQGVNPFLIVVLPGQVRVFSGFAYDPNVPEVGAVTPALLASNGATCMIEALSSFTADAINRGEIWQRQAEHLGVDQRVDTTLLKNLRALGEALQTQQSLSSETSHALIGKFVYLSYLRARDILSDKWLKEEAKVDPATVFNGEVFAAGITLESFRKIVRAVETRFNGKLFPIAWGSNSAPKFNAIRTVARVFAGEEVMGQMHLSFKAYDFASIPVEFLSSIYEQFLHAEGSIKTALENSEDITSKDDASDPEKGGAHYTPEPLADYLVSEVSSVKTLQLGMKILDPCCGSGVFLVVAYRRLVELECQRQKCVSINASELRELLESSIYAVERNRTAAQIAGFSLILAMLSYVEPPELHQRKTFKFPTLVGNNLFAEDFFNDNGNFWKKIVSPEGKALKFDCVIGNPPWVELKQDDPEAQYVLAWSKKHTADYSLARARTGEAFAWRVMDCLAENGIVGLILHAKTLTNDHLLGWRQKFFGGVQVHRVTNFANLVNRLFASAKQPAFTLIYSRKTPSCALRDILHFGPFVANQCVIGVKSGKTQRAWTIGFSESEIKSIPFADAARGAAGVWKMALWGNPRDAKAIQQLQRVFTERLGTLAETRKWTLALGLQLRKDVGTKKNPNEEVEKIKRLKVLNHLALVKSGGMVTVPTHLLGDNTFGHFVRKGRLSGLALTSGPRLFLWTNFATYCDQPFIIRHDKVCLAGGNPKQMKAVAAIWNSSFSSYLLFFITTAAWGIGYSVIDKGDAENLPFPELTPEREQKLSSAWDEAAALEAGGAIFSEVKDLLDDRVALILGLPKSVSLIVGEFFKIRYQLDRGKSPSALRNSPDKPEMVAYAKRLRSELDVFLNGKAHHGIRVLYSPTGISVSITLLKQRSSNAIEVRAAEGKEAATLVALLKAAEAKFSQWVYIKRSVRLFDGDTIHIIKPPRRLEWTETQALLDTDDIIAEILESRSSTTA